MLSKSAPGQTPAGIILYDKPAGATSHDAVDAVRRRLGRGVKVGHAGTLDPFATGLLLMLVGRATRVQRFLMELPKRYEVVARFGAVSSTGDPEGEIVPTGAVPEGDLDLPVGRLRQRPPAYSAVKIGGTRAYKLARVGQAVDLPEREVEVYTFQESWRRGERRGFVIECSSGTYVRSLIAELGDAYCQDLRRTAIGAFDVAQADPEWITPLDQALAFLPEVRLDADRARRVEHGGWVEDEAGVPAGDIDQIESKITHGTRTDELRRVVRLTDDAGLIALARRDAAGIRLKPLVVLRQAGGRG